MMKQWKGWLAALFVALVMAGCGGSDLDRPDNSVGPNGELVVDFPADLLRQKLIDAHTPGVDANTTVFGYRAYRIEYQTEDEEGNTVTASGLMVVPSDYGTNAADAQKLAYMMQKGLSLVSDSHGTIFADAEAPTAVAEATLAPAGTPIIFSSLGGFVTLQADYIGFGASADHYHPYLLERSSAAVTKDFIAAARAFAAEEGIPLNGQLFVTGYSEGGYVAMAALKSLEAEGEAVALAAPMAGPYMMDQMARGVLSKTELPIPSFMADVAYAYALAYGQPVNGLVNEPYASDLPRLFDGSLTRPEIDAQLPHTVAGLFTEKAIKRVLGADQSYWFYQALQANSTAYWAPQGAVTLLHCMGDDVVPFQMSAATESVMKDTFGAKQVSLLPVEVAVTGDPNTPVRWGHVECAPYAYGVAAQLFAKVRAQTVGY